MIVKYPGVSTPDAECHVPVIIEDLFPSILEMAGVNQYKTIQQTDGVSFVPLLKTTDKHKSEKRSLFWNYPNLWDGDGLGVGPACTIRKGDWKLIYHYDTGIKELYHLKTDIGENNNLIGVEIDTAKKLSGELSRYLRKVKAQRPTNKTTGRLVSWPDEKE